MKKQSRLNFWKGFLSATLVFACISSAMAMSGTVNFSQVTLAMNGRAVFSKGESLKASNGQSIPSSISYIDETGGGTTYLPLAYVSRLLDTPVSWDGTTSTVSLGTFKGINGEGISVTEPGKESSSLPLTREGQVAGVFTEISPIKADGFPILEKTEYRSTADYSVKTPVQTSNGDCISVTVTNKGTKSLVLMLGREYTVGRELISTQVPAGQTVTRTLRIGQENDGLMPWFSVRLSYYGAISQNMDFEISAVQFNA